MPSEAEQLKVTVSLTNEDRIVIVTDNYADFQNYITNSQKGKSTTFCMLGGKLLCIQINNVSHQKDNTNQLEVKSASTTNGDAGWKEEKGVKELFGFQKVGEKKEIEIFKSLGSRVEKLAGEKGELQTQLTQAEQEKQKLEADKKETEEKQQQLIEHLNELKVQINSLQEQLDKISETKKKELEDAKQEAEEKKTNLQTQLNKALQKLKEAEQLKSDFIAHLKKEGEESRRQVQELVGELQEKNEELETAVQELLKGLDRINEFLETEELNAEVIEELDRLYKEKEKIIAKLIVESLNENAPPRELEGKDKQIKELSEQVQKLQQEKEEFETNNPGIANLQQQLKTKGEEIAQLNAEVEKLKKDLAAKNTEVEKLQKEKKELEAKKQPTEQSKAPTYTASVGVGLAAGLAAFIALERTVRLDIWVTVGIALASALAVSGGTYLALKPSAQVNKAETQGVNKEAPAK